jgi:hypothetical protein
MWVLSVQLHLGIVASEDFLGQSRDVPFQITNLTLTFVDVFVWLRYTTLLALAWRRHACGWSELT